MGGCAGTDNRTKDINYINISTPSVVVTFGNLIEGRENTATASNTDRGVIAGGYSNGYTSNTMEYITIGVEGDAQSFGNIIESACNFNGMSDGVSRGVFVAGTGYSVWIKYMQYIDINNTSDSQLFGNLINNRGGYGMYAISSSDTGIMAGGAIEGGDDNDRTMYYIRFNTLSDSIATTYSLTMTRSGNGGCTSNGSRGIFLGGYSYSAGNLYLSSIEYVDIYNLSNAVVYGDLTRVKDSNGTASGD